MLLATALKSEKVIGMIAFSPQKIAQLYVDIDYLNLGIGTTLLNLAKEQSTDKLELFIFQSNKIARSFYRKNGFIEIGRNYENELNLPDIKYRWEKQSNS